MQNEARRFFRLDYPESYRPELQINDRCFQVQQISEEGIVAIIPNVSLNQIGAIFNATITFYDGVTFELLGRILRIEGDRVVGQLTKGINFKRMNEEQRQLRVRFPRYKFNR
ncbi:PilZ domain-containing protein [Veronia pacifica]|uniref:PilZ domain-containing protein n=1 Tax=Veronia pacifica TaxID=1080227 RepID=A0A1C3EKW1_9GAMM|nr:PilZ domain-containing protein [Veronia pacifica]ODA33873.1 hypothetical protein A8L45_08600 [Veronia pacifica]